jgi:hypothetical protein
MNLGRGGDLFVPRSGTYLPYSSVPFPLFCFARKGEDRVCLDDRKILMDWKFTVVYRMRKKKVAVISCHNPNIVSINYITFLGVC